jgi:alpha,alpha-trehalose phosphorylase
LTSQTYDGHYFWDMEMYVLPFLIYTSPRLARNVLLYRYSILDKARERARAVSQKGALFAWRTISGEEASAYYAAGTAQYHINAAIAHAITKYADVTGDREFLYQYGAEILVETARLWYDLGFFSERKDGCFHPPCNRAGRVHHGGQQQHVHEPHGSGNLRSPPMPSSSCGGQPGRLPGPGPHRT